MKELTLINLRADGACDRGFNWVSNYKGDDIFSDMAADYPSWILWIAGKGYEIPGELFAKCAEGRPMSALMQAPTSQYWTKKLFSECAKLEPWAAINYASTSPFMTAKLRKELAEMI